MSTVKNETYLEESFADLLDDCEELQYLCASSYSRIVDAQNQFRKKQKQLSPLEFTETTKQLGVLRESILTLQKKVLSLREKVLRGNSLPQLLQLTSEQDALSTLYRLQLVNVASRIVATDWQSPSFEHSRYSLAGRQTGEILGTINDYKRDQHLDGKAYEEVFVKEYVQGVMKFAVHAYATHSGMGSCMTIIAFLQKEMRGNGIILIGKNSYFENKELVKSFFKERVKEVDEADTKEVMQAVEKYQPSVIFLDSLCNNPKVTVPNIGEIFSFVAKTAKRETYLILDNTGLSFFCQPLSFSQSKNLHIRLIVFESLNKYHQFGMDRVTGGIVWGYGTNVGKLYEARDHTGTNISDIHALSLPIPSKKQLSKRLYRHSRNASLLATSLSNFLSTVPDSSLEVIYYPSLPQHPAYSWMGGQKFFGSYFTFGFKKKYQKVSFYQRFVKEVIKEANKRDLQIVSGTSFGLSTSRIYLTALRAEETVPFVRFAVGTENRYIIEKISEALKAVITRLH